MDSTQQSQDSSQQPPPFTIFNRQLQEPKHETTDGRFPPSYEEAMGIAPSSTSSVYTSEGHFSSGFTYSGWVNPESTNQTSSSNLPGSIYTVDSNQPEPYVSATVVTTRIQQEHTSELQRRRGAQFTAARAVRCFLSFLFVFVFIWILFQWVIW